MEDAPLPWWSWVAVVVGALVGLVLLDRLLLAAERRGFVYWRKRKPSRVTVSTALLSLQAIYEPQKVHVVEKRQRVDVDQTGDDEPINKR